MNNIVLECPRCLRMFMTSTSRSKEISERLWVSRCSCGNFVEFDFEYLDAVDLWAQPNVASRMRKIDGYVVRVEGLTYGRGP